MNKNQKIVLIVGLLLIAIILIYWQTQGGYTSSKTQVQVERVDELFNTTYMEWEDRFVLGLDYAGTASAVIAVLSGILIFLLRNKKQEMSNRINGLTIGLFILYLLYFCLELLNSIKNENDFEFTKLLLSRDFLIFTVIWIVLIVVIQNIRNIDFATKNSDPEYSSKSASKFSFKIISVITFSFILITLLIFKDNIFQSDKSFNTDEVINSNPNSRLIGMWSYTDNSTVPNINYFVNLRANGTYSMLDFGGDGIINGTWEQKDNTINFYDDILKSIWTRGYYSNKKLSIITTMGTINYEKK